MNAVAQALTGWRLDEVLGRRLPDVFNIVSDEAPRPAEDPATRVIRSGTSLDLANSTRLVGRNGGVTAVDANAAPIRDDDGTIRGVILVFRDVTERRALSERLRRQNEELEEQYRRITEASHLKSEFLANMSHEMRTPLNAVIGFSELLHDGKVGPVSSESRELLGDILASARHLLHLIDGLLDLGHAESGRMVFRREPVDLRVLVGEVLDIVRDFADSKSISVTAVVAPALDVVTDPLRLKQVLYHYLSNALKFTPKGGQVSVRASAEGAERFRVEVEDTGIGIRPEHIGRLFMELQQLDPGTNKLYEGVGVGLALTKRTVEAQGGIVGVRANPGAGSVFYAILPRVAGVDGAAAR